MDETQVHWRRTAIAAVIYNFLMLSVQWGKALWGSLVPLAVVGASRDNFKSMFLIVFSSAVVVLFIAAIVKYIFFLYQIRSDRISIREGLFRKQQRDLTFDRIQNINIKQPFYFKPFSLAHISLESAGAKGDEASLSGIKYADALSIKKMILSLQEHQEPLAENRDVNEPNDSAHLLAELSTKDIVVAGLSSNVLLLFSITVLPIFGSLEGFLQTEEFRNYISRYLQNFLYSETNQITFYLIILGILIITMLMMSVLGSFLKHSRFKLIKEGGILKRRSGLITDHEESMTIGKIQSISKKANFIAKFFGRENLVFEQIAAANNADISNRHMFLLPTSPPTKNEMVLKQVLEHFSEIPRLYPISKQFILRTWIYRFLLPWIFLLIPLSLLLEPTILWGLFFPLLCYPLVYLRWKAYRFGCTDDIGILQTGFLGYHIQQFELFRLQGVTIRQSPSQRRYKLATITLYSSSDRFTIPYLPYHEALVFRRNVLAAIERETRSWF
ncbi:MAG: PH domain-containing protein [Pseudobacteriovorax sp.]|nr:PH domain-containing protein [Pseudobacteriovorax sp.]